MIFRCRYLELADHRTILNAGYLDGMSTDRLNLQKILTAKVSNKIATSIKWAVKEGVEINARWVKTVRNQLKQEGIHSGWREIVRTMNTQKAVTTLAQNNPRRSDNDSPLFGAKPTGKKTLRCTKYKCAPFIKRKSVVNKSKLENCQFIDKQDRSE